MVPGGDIAHVYSTQVPYPLLESELRVRHAGLLERCSKSPAGPGSSITPSSDRYSAAMTFLISSHLGLVDSRRNVKGGPRYAAGSAMSKSKTI